MISRPLLFNGTVHLNARTKHQKHSHTKDLCSFLTDLSNTPHSSVCLLSSPVCFASVRCKLSRELGRPALTNVAKQPSVFVLSLCKESIQRW